MFERNLFPSIRVTTEKALSPMRKVRERRKEDASRKISEEGVVAATWW